MLRKCPNHGFEDIAQLSIFLNGLRSDTKMLLDDAAGGTMMVVDVEQATRIIDALATTNYQAQHDRQCIQKRVVIIEHYKCTFGSKQKILMQQIEQLKTQIAKFP